MPESLSPFIDKEAKENVPERTLVDPSAEGAKLAAEASRILSADGLPAMPTLNRTESPPETPKTGSNFQNPFVKIDNIPNESKEKSPQETLRDVDRELQALRQSFNEDERAKWRAPFLSTSPALLVGTGLGPLVTGMNCTSQNGWVRGLADANRIMGSATLGGLGAYQGYKDWHNLLDSQSVLGQSKYGMALSADAGIVSGSILTMARFGPKWLGPSVLVGAIASRALLDLIPNK